VGYKAHTLTACRAEGIPARQRAKGGWAAVPEEQSADSITPGGGLPASAGQAGSGSGEPEAPQSGRAGQHVNPLRNGPPPLGLEDVSFLTVAEVAGVMRVSKMTVYRMVHSGELAAVRVGRSFRVPAKAVRDYLSSAYVEKD
jgi:excisionase family DNA binding protein